MPTYWHTSCSLVRYFLASLGMILAARSHSFSLTLAHFLLRRATRAPKIASIFSALAANFAFATAIFRACWHAFSVLALAFFVLAVWNRCGYGVDRMKFLDVPQSGSEAATTSSRNRFGQYRRTRAIPVNPSSIFQQNVRSRMQQNADAWKALTATQREGWGALGAQFVRSGSLGEGYDFTGFMAYVSVNNNNLAAGNAVVPDAPLFSPPAPLLTLTPTATAATFSVAFTPTPLAAGERAFIYVSPQRSAGRSYESDFRLISVTAAAGTSPSNILAAYQARFGNPIVGSKIFVNAVRYSLGFVSTPILNSLIVT